MRGSRRAGTAAVGWESLAPHRYVMENQMRRLLGLLFIAAILFPAAAGGQAALRGTGLVVVPQASSPIGTSKAGLWTKASDGLPYWRKADGSDVAMASPPFTGLTGVSAPLGGLGTAGSPLTCTNCCTTAGCTFIGDVVAAHYRGPASAAGCLDGGTGGGHASLGTKASTTQVDIASGTIPVAAAGAWNFSQPITGNLTGTASACTLAATSTTSNNLAGYAPTVAGQFPISTGLATWITSTLILPNTNGSAGQMLRSNGTSPIYSTMIYDDAATSGYVAYARAANTLGYEQFVPLANGGTGNAAGTGLPYQPTGLSGMLWSSVDAVNAWILQGNTITDTPANTTYAIYGRFSQPCTLTGFRYYIPASVAASNRPVKYCIWYGGSCINTKTVTESIAGIRTFTFTTPTTIDATHTYATYYLSYYDTSATPHVWYTTKANLKSPYAADTQPFPAGVFSVHNWLNYAVGDANPVSADTNILALEPICTVP